MEIRGRQLRRLKELLPEDQREEFKKIFVSAFNKEDVTRTCEVAIVCENSWAMISVRHLNRTIAIIDLRQAKPGLRNKHEDYVFEVNQEGKYFRVYKLID